MRDGSMEAVAVDASRVEAVSGAGVTLTTGGSDGGAIGSHTPRVEACRADRDKSIDWALFQETLRIQEVAPVKAASMIDFPAGFDPPDLSELMLRAAMECVRSYTPGARQFKTYAFQYLIRRAKQEYTREIWRFSRLVDGGRAVEEATENEEAEIDTDNAPFLVTETAREYRDACIVHESLCGKSMSRIAKKYKLPRMTVSRIINRAIPA